MWVHEGGQAKEQSSHPSLWLECHTPLSSFPSPIFFFFDMHSASCCEVLHPASMWQSPTVLQSPLRSRLKIQTGHHP